MRIKSALETGFPRLWLMGELSNVKRHTSGHLYFSLKDEHAQISAVMWRSRLSRVKIPVEDGLRVIVRGSVTVYPPRGSYQLDVDLIQPLGVGELQRRFDELKRRLFEEGLFDESRKRPLPEFPWTIGIVTSETGAAFHDIVSVLERRMPAVEAVLRPVRVQGVGAAEDVAQAIREMNERSDIDVLIVGRGGGSLEDLWAFNEEVVARAIAASRIPVVSAVGHEIDVTIADFVADLRAPTPSAAAELVVRDRREIVELLGNLWYTLRQRVHEKVRREKEKVASLSAGYALNRPRDLLREYIQRLDEQERRMVSAAGHLFGVRQQHLSATTARIVSLNPRSVLKRGYAIVRSGDAIRTRSVQLATGEETEIEFHDGKRRARIES
jgi:exodeoxyribonuclease VII large subunit